MSGRSARTAVLAEPHPLDHAGAEILDEHIGAGDQTLQCLHPVRRLQVQHDRALVAVVVEERGGEPAPPIGCGPVWSPPCGFSTLMTSAPWSASNMVADGPDTIEVRSTIR